MKGRSQKQAMDEFLKEMETAEAIERTYTDAVDYPPDSPLIEQSVEEFEEPDEYTEEELEAFFGKIDLDESNAISQLSFDEMMPARTEKTGVLVQRKENKISNLLILRDLTELTPSVCKLTHCSYDAARAAGFKKWDNVPQRKQKLVLQILQQHIDKKHKYVDDTIIDKADVPTSWLAPEKF